MARAAVAEDFLQRVNGLRSALEEHGRRPQDPPRSRALRAAWDAHLRPRYAGLLRRLADLARAEHWEFGDDDEADALRPRRWPSAVADFATIHAGLSGALAGIGAAQVRWEPAVAYGVFPGKPSATTRKERKEREKAAEKEAEKKASAKAKPADSAVARTNLAIVTWFTTTRTALAADLRELRALVHDLQAAEEARLRARAGRLAAGSRDRAAAETALAEMRAGRLDARSFAGPSPAAYGTLLRQRWLRPWLRASSHLA